MSLGLGIDTGGTYTDAVLLDFEMKRVISKAKALTTYPNLEMGIAEVLETLENNTLLTATNSAKSEITLVAISTTLATNAMVEGKGGHVCLLAIGYLPDLLEERGVDKQPFVELHDIAGGHNIDGDEKYPLDLVAAEHIIEETTGRVDAYAVVALGSPFNPGHEIQIVELLKEKTDLPVVSGIEFSRELGSIKRAMTAIFNARLLPLTQQFITTIQGLLSKRGVVAPLMIVKGDGHLMRAELAVERPIETVLSGPAASFLGAHHLSGCEDGIVLDIGGTTTDIAVLKDGSPRINPQGAVVAGWRTCVRAAEIHTSGIGGDSHLRLDHYNEITVGPQRVIPLAFAANQYPSVLTQLGELEASGWTPKLVQSSDFLMYRGDIRIGGKSSLKASNNLIEKLKSGPLSLWHLTRELEVTAPSLLDTTMLESRGSLVRIGLTPTDLLHAQGIFTDWSVEAALCGIRLYARRLGISVEETISILRTAIDKKVVAELTTVLLSQDEIPSVSKEKDQKEIQDFLVKQILNGTKSPEVIDEKGVVTYADNSWSIDVKVHLPLIGIGASAQAYLPPVATVLQAEGVIPEHAEVANAVGAIISRIVETVEIDIHPVYNVTGIDRYEVRSPVGTRAFDSQESAVQYAIEQGKGLAIEKAKRAGADHVEIEVKSGNQEVTTSSDTGEQIYLGTHIQVTGVGKREG
ncbi:MAG: hydantoinase/oxoprolinase family protein [Candidatus Poribacteria bacterium]|jgi:N-methylhydantoinase A/oxoprolinase/acetone carboxylase beta subunit|nr:hydantoinase/oxoprolinase family protein [Candidatus Poribacteria bacterium]